MLFLSAILLSTNRMSSSQESKIAQTSETYKDTVESFQTNDGLYLMEYVTIKDGDVILDLGCGTGYLSSILAGRVGAKGKVKAVDPDAERIGVASRDYDHVKNLTFVQGSSEEFPNMESAFYDIIYSNHVFHWILDKDDAFNNIYKSLKPQGTVALLFPTGCPGMTKILQSVLSEESYNSFADAMIMEGLDEMKVRCVNAGLRVVQTAERSNDYKFDSLDGWMKWLHVSSRGVFDPNHVNADKLKKFSAELEGKGKVVLVCNIALVVAVKDEDGNT